MAPSGTETILVVEDEQEAREVTREFLELSDYMVHIAKDGEEAIKLAREYPDSIHLIITDMVMPGIGGKELLKQLSEDRKDLRVTLMSEYAEFALSL